MKVRGLARGALLVAMCIVGALVVEIPIAAVYGLKGGSHGFPITVSIGPGACCDFSAVKWSGGGNPGAFLGNVLIVACLFLVPGLRWGPWRSAAAIVSAIGTLIAFVGVEVALHVSDPPEAMTWLVTVGGGLAGGVGVGVSTNSRRHKGTQSGRRSPPPSNPG